MVTNRCGAERISGVVPLSVLTGFFRSAGRVRRAALLARVAVLIRRAAVGARAFDEAIGEEHAFLRVEELRDLALRRRAPPSVSAAQISRAELAVLVGVRAAVVVELDLKTAQSRAGARRSSRR